MGLAFNSSIVVLAAIRSHPKAAAGDAEAIVEQVLGSGRQLVDGVGGALASLPHG